METYVERRQQAYSEQMTRAAEEYERARLAFEQAQVELSVARERLAAVKRRAESVFHLGYWGAKNYPSVQYFGATIGEAIKRLLDAEAWEAAAKFANGENKKFQPSLALWQITQRLENGGFEFTSETPQREVNAALINLSTVERVEVGGAKGVRYRSKDADASLEYYLDTNSPDD